MASSLIWICVSTEGMGILSPMPRVWSLLSLPTRQYAGNSGYDDGPDRYSFDSFVANSRQVRAGDLAVLRDASGAFAVALIEQLTESDGVKAQRRCPLCATTALKERVSMSPAFRCSNGHEFNVPRDEQAECRIYQARFGESYRKLPQPILSSALRQVVLRYSEQHSIQELDFGTMGSAGLGELAAALNALRLQLFDLGITDTEPPTPAYVPGDADRRAVVFRGIKVRRGQPAFRRMLRQRYGDFCQVSGCGLMPLIEAAHISPYRGEDDQHVENGLLLRADLHTLFDLDLMGVEPDTLAIKFHHLVLVEPEYHALAERVLTCGTQRPSRTALDSRWALFQRRLNLGASNEPIQA